MNAQKNKKKIILFSVLALTLLVILIGTFAYFNKIWIFAEPTTSNLNLAPATSSQQKSGNQIKQDNADSKTTTGSDQPPAPVAQPSGKSLVTVSITAANQNSSALQIRALAEVVDSTGTCTLTLSKTGYTSIVKTSPVQALASSTTCQGFDIPVTNLAKGSWNIDLIFENSTLKGEAIKTIDIQ
jgi:cytoskeletal protein RodZ